MHDKQYSYCYHCSEIFLESYIKEESWTQTSNSKHTDICFGDHVKQCLKFLWRSQSDLQLKHINVRKGISTSQAMPCQPTAEPGLVLVQLFLSRCRRLLLFTKKQLRKNGQHFNA